MPVGIPGRLDPGAPAAKNLKREFVPEFRSIRHHADHKPEDASDEQERNGRQGSLDTEPLLLLERP
jgi:hypothetical protein